MRALVVESFLLASRYPVCLGSSAAMDGIGYGRDKRQATRDSTFQSPATLTFNTPYLNTHISWTQAPINIWGYVTRGFRPKHSSPHFETPRHAGKQVKAFDAVMHMQ